MIHNEKTALIDDQHGRLAAQLFQDVGTQVGASAIGIPNGPAEQALHAIWAVFSCMFSQLPPIFARYIAQDSFEVAQRSTMWLWTSKAGSQTGMQAQEFLDPETHI